MIFGNSRAIIQNNTLIENNLQFAQYVKKNSIVQLINVTFVRNVFLGNLLNIFSSCSTSLINIRMVGNSLDWMFLAQSSYLEIDTIFIKNNTFSQIIRAVKCNVSFESMKIRGSHYVCYTWHDICPKQRWKDG